MTGSRFPQVWLLGAAALVFAACTSEPGSPPPPEAPPGAPLVEARAPSTPQRTEPADAQAVTRVDTPNLVCMVNDQLMGRAQIPVEVEGRTYYGCCPNCKQRLEQNARIRSAVDPISGRSVDKAGAVLGVRPDGNILCFESEANLERFNRRST